MKNNNNETNQYLIEAETTETYELAEMAAVGLSETASGIPEVDFDAYRPRLDAFGLTVRNRIARITEEAPAVARTVLVDRVEEDCVVLAFRARMQEDSLPNR